MSQKPPPLGDALSVEEGVLGSMCDSFRSWDKRKKALFPVSMILECKIKKNYIHYLKSKKKKTL
jgi:hypothetical protein